MRILAYHGIWLCSEKFGGDMLFMPADTFDKRLATIKRLNYSVISLDQALAGLTGRGALPDSAVVVTIDDGWYGAYSHMRKALMRAGMSATLYCDTAHLLSRRPVGHVVAHHLWRHAGPAPRGSPAHGAYQRALDMKLSLAERVDAARGLATALGVDFDAFTAGRAFNYMSADELREFAESGFDVQLHSHNHDLDDFSADAIRCEIEMNRAVLAGVLGRPAREFQHFCYPSGNFRRGSERVLRDLGVVSATTSKSGLIAKGDEVHFLHRFVDGGSISQIEFEAELSGVLELGRTIRSFVLRRGGIKVQQQAGFAKAVAMVAVF